MTVRVRILPFIALCIAAATAHAADDPPSALGRLFFSAEKRVMLDAMRARNVTPGQANREDELRVDGIVRRSDGHSTVWLNGVPHHDRAPLAGLNDASARVVTGNGRTVDVAVGNAVRFVADDSAPLRP